MTLAKKLHIAGLAALSAFLLPACTSTLSGDEFAAEAPLVVSAAPLTSVAYSADYTQDGALPFTCEVKMRSDGMIRRRYIWTDAKEGPQDFSIVVRGGRTARIEAGGRVSELKDSTADMAKFFARLILAPESVVASADRTVMNGGDGHARYVYWLSLSDGSGVGECSVTADPASRLWTSFRAAAADDSFEVYSTFPEYQTVGGVKFPSRIVSTTGGAPVRCVLRDVEINPELPDELFDLPDNPG